VKMEPGRLRCIFQQHAVGRLSFAVIHVFISFAALASAVQAAHLYGMRA
jgi:hypothetical protein